jgi:hypothetical protein
MIIVNNGSHALRESAFRLFNPALALIDVKRPPTGRQKMAEFKLVTRPIHAAERSCSIEKLKQLLSLLIKTRKNTLFRCCYSERVTLLSIAPEQVLLRQDPAVAV